MECIEKHRHFQRGMPASSILNFRYFTCLLDKGHITKYQGGFAMYGYLQNENMNVSNARRKRPNDNSYKAHIQQAFLSTRVKRRYSFFSLSANLLSIFVSQSFFLTFSASFSINSVPMLMAKVTISSTLLCIAAKYAILIQVC